MSDLSPTLRSLKSSGFSDRPQDPSRNSIGFRFQHGDLILFDATNRYFRDVVVITGVINDGRSLAMLEGEIPRDLMAENEALAWLTYTIRSWKRLLIPKPNWWDKGEENWQIIPAVQRLREYKERAQAFALRSKCVLDRDHARLLRRELKAFLSSLTTETSATISFNGQILCIQSDLVSFQAIARGEPWSFEIIWPVSKNTKLPFRFSDKNVELSIFDEQLRFGDEMYPAKTV